MAHVNTTLIKRQMIKIRGDFVLLKDAHTIMAMNRILLKNKKMDWSEEQIERTCPIKEK